MIIGGLCLGVNIGVFMFLTAEAACDWVQQERPLLVSLAKGVRTQLAESIRVLSADITVVPGAVPSTKWSFGAVKAGQVIGFGAALLITQNQLSSIPTTETLILRLLPFIPGPSLFGLLLLMLGFGLR